MNKTIIFGNIGQDALVGQPAQNGNTPIKFSVAVSEKRKDADHTEWFSCTKWVNPGGSTAIAQYLKRGTKVCVAGKVSVRSYTDRDGNARASLELNVQEITLAGSASSQTQASAPVAQQPQNSFPQPSNTGEYDLPF